MSKETGSIRAKKIGDKMIQLRSQIWPEISENMLWSRKRQDGFITIPRSLPIIQRMMDVICVGAPISATYFSLWCRVFDQSVVTISNSRDLAFESGFSGQRAEATWAMRMRTLEDLGFIKIKGIPTNPFYYVLLLNPHLVIKNLLKSESMQKKEKFEEMYLGLLARLQQVGAEDLDEAIKDEKITPGLTTDLGLRSISSSSEVKAE